MAGVEIATELGDSNVPAQEPEHHPEKKPRKRLKKICSQIRDQMEFYFSDANLHKDRFIKQLIDQREDRYVPVSVFSNFNKIRQLTTDMKLVVKALSSSTTLEVSEDKEYIRRKTPYKEPKDVDDRTVYVESLPKDADHEWLKRTFAPYGKVVYVSLPRYRTSGDIKGFAFIEFGTKEAVDKACQSFQPVDPEEDKATRFPKFNKQLQSLQKQIGATGEKVEERRPRRKQTISESSSGAEGGDQTSSKRQKLSSESSDTESSDCKKDKGKPSKEGEGQETTKGRTRKRSAGEGEGSDRETKKSKTATVEKSRDSTDKGEAKEKERKETIETRKRKRSEESDDKREEAGEKKEKKEEEEGSKEQKTEERKEDPAEESRQGVMTDPQKRKRHSDVTESDTGECREVKRVRISELVDVKENVEVAHKKRRKKKRKKKKEDREKTEEVKPQLKVLPKHIWLDLRKEYLDLQRSSMKALKKSLQKIKKEETKGQEAGSVPLNSYMAEGTEAAPAATLQFTPGVIIQVDTEQPCARKELKETLSLVAEVPYVDFQDGDQQGYVRCATPEDALRVIASKPSTFKVTLLQGEEESNYWRKINADREQKRASKTRNKKRGAQKLMERAEKTILTGAPKKHILFDD